MSEKSKVDMDLVQEKVELLRCVLMKEPATVDDSRSECIALGLWFFTLARQLVKPDGLENFISDIRKMTVAEEKPSDGKDAESTDSQAS